MQYLSKFPTWPTHPFTPVLMKKRKAINMVRCNQLWLWFVAYRNPLARIFHWEPGSRIVRKKGETLLSSIPQYFTHNHAQWTKNIDTQDKLNLTFCFVSNLSPKLSCLTILKRLLGRILFDFFECKKVETLSSSIPQYFTHNHAQWTKKHWHSGQIEFSILFYFKFRAQNCLVWLFSDNFLDEFS